MSLHLVLVLLLLFLTLELSTSQPTTITTTTSLPPDAVALLTFKSRADLDNRLLYTTHDSPFDYCQWRGVKCAQGGRVVRLLLPSSLLRGTLPSNLRLPDLRILTLPNNSLSGPIPDLSPLVSLKTLVLHHNHFSSTLPPSLPSLRSLIVLDLSHNSLSGTLPENLTLLDRLTYLKLDSNQFTGPIPPLNQTILAVLDVSSNNLTGPVPLTQTLKKFKIQSFLNNPGLCGEVINKPCRGPPFFNNTSGEDGGQSPPSSPPLLQQGLNNAAAGDSSPSVSRKHDKKYVGLVLGLVLAAMVLVAAVVSLVALVRKRKEDEQAQVQEKINDFDKETTNISSSNDTNKPQRDRARDSNDTFFSSVQGESEEHEPAKKLRSPRVAAKSGSLVFCSGEEELYTLEQLMRASAELLGRGSIGTTYKAVMASQLVVTVKRLDACKTAGTSGEAFEQHMETVGVLRHPNLVPVRAYFQAKQERLIIFEYQPNGSLFNLIHGSRSTRAKPLHWTSCLKIAEDVAQGLAYIHQASKLIHGNLKSTNVLLGPDFEACLTDYCLSVLADTSSGDQDTAYAGYLAPEARKYAHRASAKSDVYAFGVLLLELLTGKPPSQHPFLAPPDMPDWVRAMRDDDGEDDMRLRMLVEVASICSLTSPEQRPTMWQVLKMITNIKEIMDDGSREGNHGYS